MILLVAQAHGVSPSRIFRRVLARRLRSFKSLLARAFHLNKLRLTPRSAAAVYYFRTAVVHRAMPLKGVPETVLPLVTGSAAEVHINHVFPATLCFVQADLAALAVRWSRMHFISLHAIETVQLSKGAHSSTLNHEDKQQSGVCIAYSDRGGTVRVLQLAVPVEHAAATWVRGLQSLTGLVRTSTRAAHWRWALSCWATTSARGKAELLRSDIRFVLLRANASSKLGIEALKQALQTTEEEVRQLELPQWLRAATVGRKLTHLNAYSIVLLLLQLCISTDRITELFDRYAVDGQMSQINWLSFIRLEQTPPERWQHDGLSVEDTEEDDERISLAKRSFERASFAQAQTDKTLTQLGFAMQLLSPDNDATRVHRLKAKSDDHTAPLALYWTACSHNSYLIGDQLTGRSTADAYRRQLLQQCRHVEIDCWDGPKKDPIVTHGHTFCTIERFEEIAKAVRQCGFVTSDLPIILSLEMHCSPKQQAKLASMMISHIDHFLLQYTELIASGRASTLTLGDLRRRVLCKGKVKPPKKQGPTKVTEEGHTKYLASTRSQPASKHASSRRSTICRSLCQNMRQLKKETSSSDKVCGFKTGQSSNVQVSSSPEAEDPQTPKAFRPCTRADQAHEQYQSHRRFRMV
mmetsp:Transcript_68515/g.205239  ORF Transcript_68515/g.205239 Transcript_68515/m.205239 type:complete len:636 (+) Transcript_68515:126-2033(+)